MTAMRLQKLVYYCQAWSIAWTDAPLFDDHIEAWAKGPVVRSLYKRGEFMVRESRGGDARRLTTHQRMAASGVLQFYGTLDSESLSDLTHREDPWRRARRGLAAGESSNAEIGIDALRSYYKRLAGDSPIGVVSPEVRRGSMQLLSLPEECFADNADDLVDDDAA